VNLRKKLIRLAHANPGLRKDILPLLKQAHGPVVLKNPDVQIYMIDKAKNNSKFYEMKVTRRGDNYLLEKRWGRLTDSGKLLKPGKMDEMFSSEYQATAAMKIHEMSKLRKGYKPAPHGEYPIGLGPAGFWPQGQAACAYIPELKDLHVKMQAIEEELEGFKYILAGLSKRKSDIAPKLVTMVRQVSEPIQALDKYLEHQLSSCH